MSAKSTPPTEQVVSREIPQLSVRAAIKPGSVNMEKRTVELVFSTGARVRRGFWEPFDEELSLDPKHVRMDRLNSGRAPLLDSHDGYSLRGQIGVIEGATVDGKEGNATVRFSKRADVEPIFQDVVDGIIRNVSVGYRVRKYEKQPVAAGNDNTVPVYRAVDWEPYEVSMVSMPADAGAGVRSATEGGPQLLPCEFVSRSEESAMEPKTPTTQAAPAAAAATTTPPAPTEDATRAAREEGAKLERDRAMSIRFAVRAAKLDNELADKLIADGVTVDQARATVLDKLATEGEKVRTEQHTSGITVGDEEHEKWQRGAAAWLFQKAAVADVVERAQKAQPNNPALKGIVLDAGEFRGLSLVDLARQSLERRGVSARGLSKLDLVGKALTHRSGGYNSTSDFAVLLENTMHKTLLAAYATTPDSWTRFCAVGTASDFRAQNRYRLGSFGTLDALNEHGEYKNKSIPDGEKTTISVSTKGNIIGLTRQAIINDDIGAFNSLAARFGRAAKLSIETDVYALIALNGGLGPTQADGQPLFHANRANVGVGSALAVDALDADRVVMAIQKDPSQNEILDLRPSVLLVPIGLGGAARVINDSQYDVSVSSKFQVPNKVRGLFRDVVDTPRLSGTRRYLLADPSVAPTFEVDFLDGQREPFMESQEGWRVDGTEWKVRLDYGVAAVDYRGAVTNAGV